MQVTLETIKVAAGEYGLFGDSWTDEWTIILEQEPPSGVPYFYKAEDDVLRFKVKPSGELMPWKTMTFIANVDKTTDELGCWEKGSPPMWMRHNDGR